MGDHLGGLVTNTTKKWKIGMENFIKKCDNFALPNVQDENQDGNDLVSKIHVVTILRQKLGMKNFRVENQDGKLCLYD